MIAEISSADRFAGALEVVLAGVSLTSLLMSRNY
jgi:hypothetical protein